MALGIVANLKPIFSLRKLILVKDQSEESCEIKNKFQGVSENS